MSCTRACQLVSVGMPAGAPAGNPRDGSVTNTPPMIIPSPKTPNSTGPQVPARPGCRTRRIPTAKAIDRSPASTKLTIWFQPSSPRLNMLIGCRVRSYPSRVRTWIATVAANAGPDTIPQPSRRRVALVLYSDVLGVIVPVVTAPGVANV